MRKITCLVSIIVIIIIIVIFKEAGVFAVNCQAGEPEVEGGFITSGRSNKPCNTPANLPPVIFNPQSAFLSFKIPSYDDLKLIFYDQSKSANKATVSPLAVGLDVTVGQLNAAVASLQSQVGVKKKPGRNDLDEGIFLVDGTLLINGSLFPGRVLDDAAFVVFVKDNLIISQNINYARDRNDGGLVFVVGKDVFIEKSVRQIDAVIISSGQICTAADGQICGAPLDTDPLIINGSLISLNAQKPIKFSRDLPDNTDPAEIINYQPKYLVILKNILSGSVQKWAEVY